MIDSVSMMAMSNEMLKIAAMDPEKREELKQFAKNTAMVLAGTGLGIGAHYLTIRGLEKAFGPSGVWPKKMTPGQMKFLSVAVPTVFGAASAYGFNRAEKRKEKELEEARARGRAMREQGVQ